MSYYFYSCFFLTLLCTFFLQAWSNIQVASVSVANFTTWEHRVRRILAAVHYIASLGSRCSQVCLRLFFSLILPFLVNCLFLVALRNLKIINSGSGKQVISPVDLSRFIPTFCKYTFPFVWLILLVIIPVLILPCQPSPWFFCLSMAFSCWRKQPKLLG